MVLIRTIMAAFIAMSVALSPAVGEVVMSSSPAEVMTADQPDVSCCQCCNPQDHSQSTTCALKCITLVGAVLPATTVTLLYVADGSPLSFVGDTSHGLVRPPPTPPPI